MIVEAPHASERVRIGAFVFDLASGDLASDTDAGPRRLAPQPARLLALLIERDGQLLTHDEIRAALWPDGQVEYEQAVHFCVRQIRAALGDAAGTPAYVETLPRRGYRLCTPVQPLARPAEASSRPAATRLRRAWPLLAAGVALAAVAGLAPWFAGNAPEPLRIAIMPFEPPPDSGDWPVAPAIADHLLADLGRDPAFAVVGPTTTAAFDSAISIADVAARTRAAYVFNGRFLAGESPPQVLIELIRAADGAHVWVERLARDADPEPAAQRAAQALRSRALK